MKWLVFSDSHGNLNYMKQAVGAEKPDKVLHLGDVIRDAKQLQDKAAILPLLFALLLSGVQGRKMAFLP